MASKHAQEVAAPIQSLIEDLEARLATQTDPELRRPLEAQLRDQQRQLAYVVGER